MLRLLRLVLDVLDFAKKLLDGCLRLLQCLENNRVCVRKMKSGGEREKDRVCVRKMKSGGERERQSVCELDEERRKERGKNEREMMSE